MLEFHFQLRPVAEIQPWGDRDKPTLHWLGLSDGWFWIAVGDDEIFRLTEDTLNYWAKEYPHVQRSGLPYTDYNVARYWEDLIEILPGILEPVPDDLAARVSDARRWARFLHRANRWQEKQEEEAAWDLYHAASAWWGSERHWDAGHLEGAPQVWLWRSGDTIHIRWDSRDCRLNGKPIWTALFGEIAVPVTTFWEAVRSFDARFIAAMGERVETLLPTLPLPGVYIDPAQLEREQRDRAGWLNARRPETATDWKAVRAAIATIEREIGTGFSTGAASPDTGSV